MLKLFGYYALHSVWNSIRKIFKTWVAIFFAVCILFGVIIGLVAAGIDDLSQKQKEAETEIETIVDITADEEEEHTPMTPERLRDIVEAISGLVIFVVLFFEMINADKSGASIFTMADVNFLFPSPMKPQTVLMFKLLTQLGMALIAGVYMVFQLPNLIVNAGLPVGAAVTLLFCFAALLVFGKLLQVLIYTVCSTYDKAKKYVRPVCYALLLLVVGGFVITYKQTGLSPFDAAVVYLNQPFTRYIPIWGWIKILPTFVMQNNYVGVGISAVAQIILAVLMIWGIWQFKADFYEEALQKSTEMQEKITANKAAQEGGNAVVQTRKKERSAKLNREGFAHGHGANVLFFKTVMNRFRFAHLHFFTKTMELYLVLAIAVSLLLKMVVHFENLYVVALILAACVFYRTMGDPIAVDAENPLFHMIPASAFSKSFWSLLGGITDNFLDIVIPMLVATAILKGNPVEAVVWALVICSVNLYSACANLFLTESLPTTLPTQIKTIIVVMFVYFGAMPPAILLIIGVVLKKTILFALITVAADITLSAIGYVFGCLLMERGRR